jgi:hypothetical protein
MNGTLDAPACPSCLYTLPARAANPVSTSAEVLSRANITVRVIGGQVIEEEGGLFLASRTSGLSDLKKDGVESTL